MDTVRYIEPSTIPTYNAIRLTYSRKCVYIYMHYCRKIFDRLLQKHRVSDERLQPTIELVTLRILRVMLKNQL